MSPDTDIEVSRSRPSRTLRKASNPRWFARETSTLRIALWALFMLLACAHFALTYNSLRHFLDFNRYTEGLALTPYQMRVLPMYLFRLTVNLGFVRAIARHAPGQLRDPHMIVQLVFSFLSMIGSTLASLGTLTRLTRDPEFSRWFSLMVIYMTYFNLAPSWGLSYTLPYDTPSLFFFCFGLYLLVAQRLWLYYILFPFAVLNRETACFLTLFLMVYLWREGRGRVELVAHALTQGAIWIGIRAYVSHEFANNPSDGGKMFSMELIAHRLPPNGRFLLEPQQWPVLLSICGFLLPAIWLGRRWIRNESLAWGCGIVCTAWFAGMMLLAVIPEIRVFSELTAFLVPALGLIVHNRFRPAELML